MEQSQEPFKAVIIEGELTGQIVQINGSECSLLSQESQTAALEMNLDTLQRRIAQLETTVGNLKDKLWKLNFERGNLEERVLRLELQRESDYAQIAAEVEIMKLQMETRTLRAINSWPHPSDQ